MADRSPSQHPDKRRPPGRRPFQAPPADAAGHEGSHTPPQSELTDPGDGHADPPDTHYVARPVSDRQSSPATTWIVIVAVALAVLAVAYAIAVWP